MRDERGRRQYCQACDRNKGAGKRGKRARGYLIAAKARPGLGEMKDS